MPCRRVSGSHIELRSNAEHAVLGSEYFRYDELAGNLALLREHQDVISRVITHRFAVEELDDAFAVFLSGETGKVVVTQEGVY